MSDSDTETEPRASEAGEGASASRGRIGRGRGSVRRPRSVRRGSSRGRARGHSSITGPSDFCTARENKRERMKAIIDTVDETKLRGMFTTMLEKYPSLVFDVLEPGPARPTTGFHPSPDHPPQHWCVCGKCRKMMTIVEQVCCGKTACVTLLADFEVLILNEAVLSLARKYRQDMIRADDEADDNSRANRHAAYRQFILWLHGRLGTGQRRVIPSCCVSKIRDKFPDQGGIYTGFRSDRFGD